ncbi:hypothetical protein [Larkinella knui]|uniref:T9SS C-terminal target domain-containing protein n=1 Tax=Larkinella knui TaxID=2025310 RepID=A0A3P1CGU0_9BACT|nr:hypothetical protein [Larkinella knui]RRB12246.1 hypothetical protein EHT87_18745 [Larkinella knui]
MASLSKLFTGYGIFGLLCLALFSPETARAQQVQVTVNVLPPYSAYIQDYATSVNRVQIFVRNTTATPVNIRLQASVTGDNGVDIRTLPNFRPVVPLRLGPLENKLLTRPDLEGLFDLNQISVEGLDKNLLYQGKPLPDGQYQLCLQVFDNATSRQLSAGEPLGCSPPFPVRAIEPPILIAPLCDGETLPATPQATVFTWTPPAGISPTQVSYTLRVVELPLENVDPNVFIDAVALPPSGIEIKNLLASTFLYGPQYLPLKPGKRYAWRVQAVDKTGRLNLLNNGKSPVCAFRYGPMLRDPIGDFPPHYLTFLKPGEGKGKKLPEVPLGYGNPLYLSWEMAGSLATMLSENRASPFDSKIVAKAQPRSYDLTKTNLSYRVLIKTLAQPNKPAQIVLDRQVKTPYLSAEKVDLPPTLLPGKPYRAEVELVGLTALQRKTFGLSSHPIAAEPRSFSLVTKNSGSQSDSVYVKGVLVFRYPGENGGGHLMPNTWLVLKRIEKSGYENNMGYTKTNALGEFTVAVARWQITPTDTVAKPNSYQVRYRVVSGNMYLLPSEQTFTISHEQVGTLDAGTILMPAKGYRLRITARQAYKDWPGAPNVSLSGKRLVLYRKPNQQVDDYLLPLEGQIDRSTHAQNPAQNNTMSGGQTTLNLGTGISAVNTSINTPKKAANSEPVKTDVDKKKEGIAAQLQTDALQKEVEQAGYTFIGITTLQADGNAFKASIDQMLYAFNPLDKYAVYCPDCGQKPDDAETFWINAPKEALSPVLARTENYTFNIQTTEAPTVTFKGKLTYQFADPGKDGADVRPLGKTTVRLQVVYRRSNGKSLYYNQVPSGFTEFHKTLNQTLATDETDQDGNFSFSVKLTKPLELGTLDAVTESNADFGTDQNVYVRTLQVLVDNAYYTHPSSQFGDTAEERIQPQGQYDLGTLLSKVRSYGLTVEVRSDTTGLGGAEKQVSGIQQALSGIAVHVLRRPLPVTPGQAPPKDEGQGLNEKMTLNGVTYAVVSSAKTNAEGIVKFTRLVVAKDEADTYLIATQSGKTGQNNYEMASLKSILISEKYYPDCMEHPYSNASAAQLKEAIAKGQVTYKTDVGTIGSVAIDCAWTTMRVADSPVNNSGALMKYTGNSPFTDGYKYSFIAPIMRYLKPGNPSVNVRVVDKTNPTKGIWAAEVSLNYGKQIIAGHWSDPSGYASFTDLPTGKNAVLTIEKEGYIFDSYVYYDPAKKDTVKMPAGKELKINLGDLMLGQNVYIDRILMQPNTRYIGSTVDQDAFEANPGVQPKPSLEAYVQIDDGYYFKTFPSNVNKNIQRFAAYAPSSKADSLKIYPVNISYFNEFRLVSQLPKPVPSTLASDPKGMLSVDAGEVKIYQRDHRISFFLLDNVAKKPIKGGTVRLFGRNEAGFVFGPSDADGLLDAQFKNVSVENLFVEILAPGYVTKTQSVTNVESKSSKIQPVLLEPASLIKGVVVVKTADNKEKPLVGAEVFVAGGSNTQTPYSTTSGPGGSFTLAVGKQLKDVTIQATYREEGSKSASTGPDGKPLIMVVAGESYAGATEKNYPVPQAPNASLKLTLTSFDKFKIATIWGFPIKVETLTALPNGTVRVSGEVDLSSPHLGPFAILDPDLRVRFENVIFKPSASDPKVGEPTTVNVPLKTGILDNLGYYSKLYKSGDVPLYNIRLTAFDNVFSGGNFQIVKSEGSSGVIMAQAQVIDNSFKFSENLLKYQKGQFFLYDPKTAGQPGTRPIVVAFDSGTGTKKRTDFGICSKDGKPIELELLAFKATSSLEGSRLMGDEIHLSPTLTCHLKDAIPSSLTVNVGDLVLKNNTVDAKSGQTPLTFTLAGKWSVEVRNWVLDYKQGGFYATEGVVKTGKVDMPISLFNLRADFFKLDAKPTNTLDLAGIAQINLGGKAFFGYDQATGSDLKGHWALVVVPDGNKQAGVLSAASKLPGLSSDLTFETISLLDNGEDVFSFGASSQLVNYYGGVMTVRPKTIETGPDYFSFDAGMSTTIPNAPKDIPVRLTYYKPGGTGPVTLKTIVPGGYTVDTKGQVRFVAGQDVAPDGAQKTAFYFGDKIMAIRGMVEEPGKLKLGQTDNVKNGGVVLVHSIQDGGFTYITHDVTIDLNDSKKVESLPVQAFVKANYKPLKIELGGKSFGSVQCYQPVKSGQWDLLTFSGIPQGYTMIPEKEENRLTFTNYGSIRAENQKIKADGIGGEGGFPGMSLEYDMPNSRFTGTVTLPPNMPLPPTMRVQKGVAQVRIDPKGFYLVASATVENVPLIIPVTMTAGLMLGYYDSPEFKDAESVLFSNTHRKSLPCAFGTGFKGVFVNGQLPIPVIDNFTYQQSFGVGEVKMGLNAYVDGYAFANYQSGGGFTFGTGLGAGVHYYAYGQVLNVSASGSIDVDGASQFALNLNGSTVSMAADMKMSANFNARLNVDLGIDSYSVDQTIGFCLGMNMPNLSYTIGGGASVSAPKFSCDFNSCEEKKGCQSVSTNQ